MISTTFSALSSPERERLKLPVKIVSSTTVTLACMKSWTEPASHGVERLPENGAASTRSSSGSFHVVFPFRRHW